MKSFYAAAVLSPAAAGVGPLVGRAPGPRVRDVPAETRAAGSGGKGLKRPSVEPCPARIAVYDAQGAPPRVEEIAPLPIGDYISQLSSRAYEIARALGGSIPYAVVNEVVENFIHADFREPVVTILDSGDTIRFSDQGPGIANKQRAIEPGYTTATREMKRYVRGVGSGLPLARECLSFSGGSLLIEDNLGCGAVVTVSSKPAAGPNPDVQRSGSERPRARGGSTLYEAPTPHANSEPHRALRVPLPGLAATDLRLGAPPTSATSAAGTSAGPPPASIVRLTNRQKRVLALVMEAGSAGPSLVARELAIGLSTAYRDLARLEEFNLISADDSGKRIITEDGACFLTTLLHAE